MIETPEHGAPLSAAPEPADVAPFRCDATFADDHARLVVRGELDLATAPVLEAEVLAALARPLNRLVMDFAGVTFLDSSGVAALIVSRAAAVQRGVTFVLESVTYPCRRALDLSGLSELFDIDG